MPIAKKKSTALAQPGMSIADAMDALENRVGRGTILLARDLYSPSVTRVPSGSFALDVAMGGGFVRGACHTFWGDSSSGKTTAALKAIAQFQRAFPDLHTVLIASEQFSPINAEMNGVDLSKLVLVLPVTGEAGFNAAEALIRTRQVSFLVVDSVDGLIPQAELEGSMEDQQRGAQPRMLNKALRKLYSAMQPVYNKETKVISYETGTTVLFVSQMRINQSAQLFQNPEMIGGGKGFYHAQKIVVRFAPKTKGSFISKPLGEKMKHVGVRKNTQCVKNNTYPPDLAASFDYYFDVFVEKKRSISRLFLPGFIDLSKDIIGVAFDNELLPGDLKKKVTFEGKEYTEHSLAAYFDGEPIAAHRLMKQILEEVTPQLPKTLAKHYGRELVQMENARNDYREMRKAKNVSPAPRTVSEPVRMGSKRKPKTGSPNGGNKA
jgi:recombination protein RecA